MNLTLIIPEIWDYQMFAKVANFTMVAEKGFLMNATLMKEVS